MGPIIGGELSESQKLRKARVSLNLADSGHGLVTPHRRANSVTPARHPRIEKQARLAILPLFTLAIERAGLTLRSPRHHAGSKIVRGAIGGGGWLRVVSSSRWTGEARLDGRKFAGFAAIDRKTRPIAAQTRRSGLLERPNRRIIVSKTTFIRQMSVEASGTAAAMSPIPA